MKELMRFGVSLEKELSKKFDAVIRYRGYGSRSEAIRDLIRAELVKKEWESNAEVAASISLVYSHHQRNLVNQLMDIQHHHHEMILSIQHIHLDEDNCLEIVVLRGKAKEAEHLFWELKSVRGVKDGHLTMSSTGKNI